MEKFSIRKIGKKEGKLSIAEFKGFLVVFYNMGLIRKVSISVVCFRGTDIKTF
jgi:hypothetical protein